MIDFSVIDKDQLERSCSTRGGTKEVESHEKVVQEERERSKLLVIYTSLSDIPSSPREPAEPYTGEQTTEKDFGSPNPESVTKVTWFYMYRLRICADSFSRSVNLLISTHYVHPNTVHRLSLCWGNHQPQTFLPC